VDQDGRCEHVAHLEHHLDGGVFLLDGVGGGAAGDGTREVSSTRVAARLVKMLMPNSWRRLSTTALIWLLASKGLSVPLASSK
jgi:hypothetical protein